jgi:hypothetical protein
MHRYIPFAALFTLLAGCSNSSGSSPQDSGVDQSTGSTSSSGGSSGAGSSSGSGSSSSGSGTSSGGVDAGEGGVVSFDVDVYPLVAAHCVGCHHPAEVGADGGAKAPGGGFTYGKLDMSTVDAAYPNLVNAPAQGPGIPSEVEAGVVACADLPDGSAGSIRVIPGNAAVSLLYLKVHGFPPNPAPPCGSAMPLEFGPLPDGGQDELASEIQSWINAGANP